MTENDLVFILAFVSSITLVVLGGKIYIPWLHKKRWGQEIQIDGPQNHLSKSGTPTMGGILTVATVVIVAVFINGFSIYNVLFMLALVGYALIGFYDDYIKVCQKRNLGLTARQKILLQFLVAVIFCLVLYLIEHSTVVVFFGLGFNLDFGIFYYPFIIIIILATTNSVNLTDGVDGLVSGINAIVFSTIAIIAYYSNNSEAVIFAIVLVGASLGFLFYNRYPARVFMGDTGSLAMGGVLAVLAVVLKIELLLIIIGLIFVVEALSVILQVISFKLTGKRILLMSPVHHHFELKGWSEWRIVKVFWTLSLVFSIIGLMLFFSS